MTQPGTIRHNGCEIQFLDFYREDETTWIFNGVDGNEYVLNNYYISGISFGDLESTLSEDTMIENNKRWSSPED